MDDDPTKQQTIRVFAVVLLGTIVGGLLYFGRPLGALAALLVVALFSVGLMWFGAPPIAFPGALYIVIAFLFLVSVGIVLALRRETARPAWYSHWLSAIIIGSGSIYLVGLLVSTFVLRPFSVPSISMAPALLPGDNFSVSRWAYGIGLPFGGTERLFGGPPKRGDIAIFRLPRQPSVHYVKRVVGLPGDKLVYRDGVLEINGEPVKSEKTELGDGTPLSSGSASYTAFIETLPGGVSYRTLRALRAASPIDTSIDRIPDGMYFVLGDNRDNSSDSRMPEIGLIPIGNFVGRAETVFWNATGMPYWDRRRLR